MPPPADHNSAPLDMFDFLVGYSSRLGDVGLAICPSLLAPWVVQPPRTTQVPRHD